MILALNSNLVKAGKQEAQMKKTIAGKHINKYLIIFLTGFLMYVICVIPYIIWHGGIFFYYGDYNVQQVPFYILAHRAVRNGYFFWNPYIDLGGNMTGCFAFYLWGSPFFWFSCLFPENMIPYLMPFLMAAKYGLAMTTSFAWIRTNTKTDRAAFIGAVLYAFSGFQACNIVFQHFHEVTAFFPLYLLMFDRAVQKKRYVPFALMTAFMAVLNYYFFFGEMVFFALYYIVRYVWSGEKKSADGSVLTLRFRFRTTAKQMLALLASVIAGAGVSAFYLVQVLGGILGNTRLNDFLSGYDAVCYKEPTTPLAILKSLFVIPDLISRGTLFSTDSIKSGSLACYLPCLALTGVVAYCTLESRKKDWKKRLLIIFAVMAFVPILNSLFSALNAEYYARWYYLPILLMSAMTARALEEDNEPGLRKGFGVSVTGLVLVLVCACIPVSEDGTVTWFGIAENMQQLWTQIAVTALTVLGLVYIVFYAGRKQKAVADADTQQNSAKEPARIESGRTGKPVIAIVIASALLCTMAVLYSGNKIIARTGGVKWRYQMLDSRPELPDQDTYARVETGGTDTNYEMVWGYPTIHCFCSTVNPSVFKIFDGIGMVRTVESTLPFNRVGIRSILSLRYYIENILVKDSDSYTEQGGLPGFDLIMDSDNEKTHGHNIYENQHYIPMGFTFDSYVTEDEYDAMDKDEDADRLLVRDIILTVEQATKYRDILEVDPDARTTKMSDQEYFDECDARAESSCTEFEFSSKGFTATTADLDSENLVFFSVPYDKGFTAYVDGVKTDVECVDYGMMAVDVPAGMHSIEFVYVPYGFGYGVAISIVSAAGLIIFAIVASKRRKHICI